MYRPRTDLKKNGVPGEIYQTVSAGNRLILNEKLATEIGVHDSYTRMRRERGDHVVITMDAKLVDGEWKAVGSSLLWGDPNKKANYIGRLTPTSDTPLADQLYSTLPAVD